MQSTSTVQNMPRHENVSGFELREGQKRLIFAVQKNPDKRQFNVQFPTGYGKTLAFAVIYKELKNLGIVNRAIVVVPTIIQREQYEDDFAGACNQIGMAISGVKRVEGDATTLKYHKTNRAEIFVIGVDKLVNNLPYIHDLVDKGRWLLVADEHHRYGEDMQWGNAVKELQTLTERTLAMSATPLRRGGVCSIFGKPDEDLTVSLLEGIKEKAIKRIKANIEHYFIDLSYGDDYTARITTEELRNDAVIMNDISAWETKQQIRYLSKYVSPLLSNAITCLNRKQIEHPNQHQMIIYAMSCKHAESLCQSVRALGLGDVSVDWIGVGPNGRTDDENSTILDRFKKRDLDCLVQVNKAGEGFNVRTASVLVFLNLLGVCPQAEQQIGRGLRRNYAISDFDKDICDVFIPADSKLVDLILEMESLDPPELPGEPPIPGGGSGGSGFQPIPPWGLVDVEHDRSEAIWVIDPNDPRLYPISLELQKVEEKRGGRRFDPSNPEDMANLAEAISQYLKANNNKQSEDEKLKQCRSKNQKAVNILAGHVIKIRSDGTGSFERSMYGDIAKRIHGYWKRSNGGHNEMLLEDLERKYKWVKSIDDDLIGTGEIPPWLVI